MATYSLSGTGVQTLSANVTALHVSITAMPGQAGNGNANPSDAYDVGLLRLGDATGFLTPFQVLGGPQWVAVPIGSTRCGYVVRSGGVISVVEVIGGTPPFGTQASLAGLSDVALGSLSDTQVLTYQASSGKWINAASSSGGGGATWGTATTTTLSAVTASVRFPASGSLPTTYNNLRLLWVCRTNGFGTTVRMDMQFNADTSNNYDTQFTYSTNTIWNGGNTIGWGYGQIADILGSTPAAGHSSTGQLTINNYLNSAFYKQAVSQFSAHFGSASGQVELGAAAVTWRNVAPLTSILLYPDSGSFIAGSTFTLYLEQ